MRGAGTVATTAAWINTAEYKELNFARKALVINPTKACQPLGAFSRPRDCSCPGRASTSRPTKSLSSCISALALYGANRLTRSAA